MIRVELLHGHRRQLPPWFGPVLFALVICGGLYGLNWIYPFGLLLGGSAGEDEVASQSVWQQEQSAAADSWAADETDAVQAVDPPDIQIDAPSPPPAAAVAESASWDQVPEEPVQQAPPTQQQVLPPAPVAVPVVAASSTPPVVADGERFDGARQAPRRSAACQWAVRINERVPRGIRLGSLTCNATGEYGLEGTSASQQSLRALRDLLQKLPSQVSLSSWQEGRASAKVLRFAFQGRFEEMPSRELATLSKDQADRLFGKVAHWADESGLDDLSIKKPITMPLPPSRIHQRQKLWGTGSYQQIGAFFDKLQQVEETAVLGEVVLRPVQTDERGWVEAQVYAVVDVVVGMP